MRNTGSCANIASNSAEFSSTNLMVPSASVETASVPRHRGIRISLCRERSRLRAGDMRLDPAGDARQGRRLRDNDSFRHRDLLHPFGASGTDAVHGVRGSDCPHRVLDDGLAQSRKLGENRSRRISPDACDSLHPDAHAADDGGFAWARRQRRAWAWTSRA